MCLLLVRFHWVAGLDVAVRGEHGHGADGARAAKGAGTHIQGADRRPREQTGADADAPVHPRHLPAPSQTVGHGHCGKRKFPHGSFALKQIMRSASTLSCDTCAKCVRFARERMCVFHLGSAIKMLFNARVIPFFRLWWFCSRKRFVKHEFSIDLWQRNKEGLEFSLNGLDF